MKLKNLLIANPENNYRPWIVSKTAMACFIVTIWALRLFLPSYIAVGSPGLDSADLMSRINTERTNRQIPALSINDKLVTAAGIKSQDMIDRDYFAHVDPDGNYAWPLIESQGYKPYKSLGENLAVDFTSAAAVVNAWMNSPGHRANLLSEKYQDQGMAAIYGDFENHNTYLITNLFGTLLQSPVSEPASDTTITEKTAQESVSIKPLPQVGQTNQETAEVVQANTATESQPAPAAFQTQSKQNTTLTPTTKPTEHQDLRTLKVVVGIFAGIYTCFLALDSYIIHLAKINRENISSSPHAVIMLMISIINFFTIWF